MKMIYILEKAACLRKPTVDSPEHSCTSDTLRSDHWKTPALRILRCEVISFYKINSCFSCEITINSHT